MKTAIAVLTACLLCAPLTAQTRHFLSKLEAVAAAFPQAVKAHEWRRLLTKPEIRKLETSLRRRLAEGGYYVYLVEDNDGACGIAVVTAEIGKTDYFTFLVAAGMDRRVCGLEVLTYREPRGGEIRRRSFLKQFLGKSRDQRLRLSREIENVPGATLSALAVTRGVRKVLTVMDLWFKGMSAQELQALFQEKGKLCELPGRSSRVRRLTFPAMGTACALVLEDVDEQKARRLRNLVRQEIHKVERRLSVWCEDSELARVQRQAGWRAVTVSEELLADLYRARTASRESHGAFDPTILPALQADAGVEVQQLVDYRKIVLDAKQRTLRFQTPGMAMTTDAFAKGIAVDQAVKVLRQHGVTRARVGFRSTFYLLGKGHKVPLRDGRVLTLANCAVGASGAGDQKNHILDPRTLMPAGFQGTAVVITSNAFAADWLATAALVLGPDQTPQILGKPERRFFFFDPVGSGTR
ncbi:MAG: FAD:protein FMN transferase [Planctomycetota bacterium]|jgi:thiamine biosynthesis lipoprotein